MLCNIYFQKRDLNAAEKVLNKLIEAGRIDQNLAGALIQIYKSRGMSENDAYRKLYKKFADSLEALGKTEEAKTYRDAYNQMKQSIRF